MKIRWIVYAGVLAGAGALALTGCARNTEVGSGLRYGGGASQTRAGAEAAAAERGAGWGQQPASGPDAPPAEVSRLSGRSAGRREVTTPASDRTGSEVADNGRPGLLVGRLEKEGGEWYLQTEDTRYLLHIGNPGYVERTGVDLRTGQPVEISGLIDGGEVTVESITVDGRAFPLRTQDGRPLWAVDSGSVAASAQSNGAGGRGNRAGPQGQAGQGNSAAQRSQGRAAGRGGSGAGA